MIARRRLDRPNLTPAHGVLGEPLLPWDALNAPFEGAWVVVVPGTASAPHAHHEYEIFIGLAGRSTLVVDDERIEFAAGDIVHLPPGCTHQVVNDDTEPFEYYGIWWDTDMSGRFADRHEAETR